jgi:hypothetical protein
MWSKHAISVVTSVLRCHRCNSHFGEKLVAWGHFSRRRDNGRGPASAGSTRARNEGSVQELDFLNACNMEQSPALAFIAHPPDHAGRLPDKQAETSSAGATERVRVHHAPSPAVAEVQDATRLYCLRQALGAAPEGMRKQLGKERLPARAPWRDNEF